MRAFALVVVVAILLPRVAAAARCDYECEPEPAASLPGDELMSWSGNPTTGMTLVASTDCSDSCCNAFRA